MRLSTLFTLAYLGFNVAQCLPITSEKYHPNTPFTATSSTIQPNPKNPKLANKPPLSQASDTTSARKPTRSTAKIKPSTKVDSDETPEDDDEGEIEAEDDEEETPVTTKPRKKPPSKTKQPAPQENGSSSSAFDWRILEQVALYGGTIGTGVAGAYGFVRTLKPKIDSMILEMKKKDLKTKLDMTKMSVDEARLKAEQTRVSVEQKQLEMALQDVTEGRKPTIPPRTSSKSDNKSNSNSKSSASGSGASRSSTSETSPGQELEDGLDAAGPSTPRAAKPVSAAAAPGSGSFASPKFKGKTNRQSYAGNVETAADGAIDSLPHPLPPQSASAISASHRREAVPAEAVAAANKGRKGTTPVIKGKTQSLPERHEPALSGDSDGIASNGMSQGSAGRTQAGIVRNRRKAKSAGSKVKECGQKRDLVCIDESLQITDETEHLESEDPIGFAEDQLLAKATEDKPLSFESETDGFKLPQVDLDLKLQAVDGIVDDASQMVDRLDAEVGEKMFAEGKSLVLEAADTARILI